MYGPLSHYATRPKPMNQLAVVAAVFTGLTALAVAVAFLLMSQAHGEEGLGYGFLGLFLGLGSFLVAGLAAVLSVCAIVTRRGKRGLGLAIASTILSGGWFLLGVGLWIHLGMENHWR